MLVKFWKFSTAGNTTLFTEKAGTAGQALAVIGAEQAGFADPENQSLLMAGGEFCGNACLAYASLLEYTGKKASRVRICKQDVRLGVSGGFPDWRCEARFALGGCQHERCIGGTICKLPGIVHKLIECDEFPDESRALASAQAFAREAGAPAAGIIWWRSKGGQFEILPAVAAPGAGTCNLEQACGSGSIALASILPQGRHTLVQPSGEALEISFSSGMALLSGPVHFLACGEFWSCAGQG